MTTQQRRQPVVITKVIIRQLFQLRHRRLVSEHDHGTYKLLQASRIPLPHHIKQAFTGEQDSRPRIVKHVGKAVRRQLGVQRNIGSTTLQHRQQCRHHLHRTVHQNTDPAFRPGTKLYQPPRQPIRPLIHLPIRELRPIGIHHGHRIGGTNHLLLKKCRQTVTRHLMRGVIPLPQHLLTLSRRQHIPAAQGILGVGLRQPFQGLLENSCSSGKALFAECA
jgi:hypothetical protein